MKDRTPYQQNIIKRYYENFDAIKQQQLAEIVTEIFLADGKKRARLWKRAESILTSVGFPESRIALLMERQDPARLAEVLAEIEKAGK
jgi:hypothetical protein